MMPFYLGYEPDQLQYGLWQPMLDRFLFIVPNLQRAHDMRQLAAGRYNLLVCDLHIATNYTDNLIDNLCCENWTISETTNFLIGHYQSNPDTIAVGNLAPSTELLDWNIANEKTYLQILWHWLTFIDYCRNQMHTFLQQESTLVRRLYSDDIPTALSDFLYDAETEILKVLFTDKDNTSIIDRCRKIVEARQSDGLAAYYDLFLDSHA